MAYGLTEIRRAPAPPFAPLGLTATANGPHEIDLACDACPLAHRYEFQRSADGLSGWSTIATVLAPAYANTGLTALTGYFYRVRGVNAAGSGLWSSTASATTETIHPLTDLVAGWALTAGPQQTLSSAGVVASGPLNLSDGASATTYDSDGAHLTTDGWLQAAGAALDPSPNKAVLVATELEMADWSAIPSDAPVALVIQEPGDDNLPFRFGAFARQTSATGGRLRMNLSDFDDGAVSGPADSVPNGRSLLLFLYDPGAQVVGVSVGGGAFTTGSAASGSFAAGVAPVVFIGGQGVGSAGGPYFIYRRTRLWIGPNASALAADASFRSWLSNSGAGRTDAELAAYTP